MRSDELLAAVTDEWLRDKIDGCRSCGHSGVLSVGADKEDVTQWINLSLEEIEHEYATRHPN